MDDVAVIDFETTGISPDAGARATEIAAVIVREGRIVDRYQSLMNAGAWVPPFIEELTGITNEMVRAAPPAATVMREVAEFVGRRPMVAHNASFDRRFWDAELSRLRVTREQEFACTMLLARRVYPHAPNHKLGTLVRFAGLPVAGRAHRAMADAEMAASLLSKLEEELVRRFALDVVTHELLRAIQGTQRDALGACIARFAAPQPVRGRAAGVGRAAPARSAGTLARNRGQ
jgi:DNA polymerase-3 subunit epsilon